MIAVKNYFEKTGEYEILEGHLVITTDKYVKSKLKTLGMSFKHRKRMIDLSIKHNNKLSWIKPSLIECASAIEYMKKLKLDDNNNKILNINLIGADKILNKNGKGKWQRYTISYNNGHRNCLTVAIKRDLDGFNCKNIYKLYLNDLKNNLCHKNAFQFLNIKIKSVSSTNIRKILIKYLNDNKLTKDEFYKELDKMVFDICKDYMWNNLKNLWLK